MLGQGAPSPGRPVWGLRILDTSLVVLFLALTFLLGIFPIKDSDLYWHLRTGDLIRKTGQIPRVDFYTFTRAGTPWIDLHWLFQVGISHIHEYGGISSLIATKAVVICLAVFLLLTARRPSWPIWMMVLAWLPASLVLSARMYVRPETLSLLFLSIELALISRWDRYPALAWGLPLVQVVWVNSHGLFVLGPIIVGFALVDATLRVGAFAAERTRWWKIVVPACVAVGLVCLVNPYGIRGVVFPLELARTLSNPIFYKNIAEFTPISLSIERSGLNDLPLRLHLLTMSLGALSFLIPLLWVTWVRLRGPAAGTKQDVEQASSEESASGTRGSARPSAIGAGTQAMGGRKRQSGGSSGRIEPRGPWRINVLRLLLFLAFSALSLQAIRNRYLFAAVAGAVTAWNFAEWAAAWRSRALEREPRRSSSTGLMPRLLALVAVASVMAWVGSGRFYAMTREGRTIAWGEDPLWFSHEATRFAGSPGMPERFLSYHNAHASLFEYYFSPEHENGPGRTVFTDPRLEVAGAELFDRYQKLGERIADDYPGWEGRSTGSADPASSSITRTTLGSAQLARQPALEMRMVRPGRGSLRS